MAFARQPNQGSECPLNYAPVMGIPTKPTFQPRKRFLWLATVAIHFVLFFLWTHAELLQSPSFVHLSHQSRKYPSTETTMTAMKTGPRVYPMDNSLEEDQIQSSSRMATAAPKRVSQFSACSETSNSSDGKRKLQVGPWKLGRTLGKGSSGTMCVRFC